MVSAIAAGSRLLAEDLAAWSTQINTNVTDIAFLRNPPGAQLRQSVAQSIPSGGFTPLTFTTEDYDNYNGHSTSSNTSRYVCQVAGRYLLSGKIGWTANATGQRVSQWYVNGSGVNGSQTSVTAATAAERQHVAVTITVLLAVSDYVELIAFQDSGGALNTSVANGAIQSFMSIRWVGTS